MRRTVIGLALLPMLLLMPLQGRAAVCEDDSALEVQLTAVSAGTGTPDCTVAVYCPVGGPDCTIVVKGSVSGVGVVNLRVRVSTSDFDECTGVASCATEGSFDLPPGGEAGVQCLYGGAAAAITIRCEAVAA